MVYGEPHGDGLLIWKAPGGNCTAMATVPANNGIMEGTLDFLERNNWQLNSMRMYACPLAKRGGTDFGETA
jgi:hypothetical protein